MLVGLVILPWAITFICCPAVQAFGEVKWEVYRIKSVTFAWGVAQVLAMFCFVRIGVSLTYGILCSVGATVGVIVPMIFKASGVFKDAPDLMSMPGAIILIGTVVMFAGVVFASLAGAGAKNSNPCGRSRDAMCRKPGRKNLRADFLSGWQWSLPPACFRPAGDSPSSIATNRLSGRWKGTALHTLRPIGFWAVSLFGAALPNVLFPACL